MPTFRTRLFIGVEKFGSFTGPLFDHCFDFDRTEYFYPDKGPNPVRNVRVE